MKRWVASVIVCGLMALAGWWAFVQHHEKTTPNPANVILQK